MWLMSKSEYLIIPKGTKFSGQVNLELICETKLDKAITGTLKWY